MRAQVWPDVLVAVAAVVLGTLVTLGLSLNTLEGTSKVVLTLIKLGHAEAVVEHNTLKPVFVTKLYYDGNMYVGALEDTNRIVQSLEDLNVEVMPA